MNLLIAMVALTITRDPMTILPREVPAHEVPIAQAIFGEDNVEVHGPVEGQRVELDITQEPDRLKAKYGEEAVAAAYGVNYKAAISKACKENGIEAAGAPVDLADMTKAQLLEHAAAVGVTVDPAATKAKIIEAIEAAGAPA
ncbi:hypothetical protein [Hydrogenophaga sp. 2FB]|uniref:hypothetical protein n=1 Tax=Hydrogenophaga sp. 2FB TaxID=2502187 RepID=UPI0010F92AC5|nr:hypothetical protein [Hydrogenophaga sp. 2FB]